ncbi:class II fumarate hydratase [Halorhodospira halochloris]|nr:class II fumarate hydratase [Halorhodospira halochloris]MCG5547898.1 class II fumarate hydratase [Halorhodospira halochloris]
MQGYRIERDSMGELRVPEDALYGAQTQRAVNNFPVSGEPMPAPFIRALGMVKAACARANRELDGLDPEIADAITAAADAVARNEHDDQFPVDIFQTGSGTSSNMNANEVIAKLAAQRSGVSVHPNDHVNMGQSSNDVIPTAIHVSAALEVHDQLLPALTTLADIIDERSEELAEVTTTGRTHLMDAMPVTLGQELSGWSRQIRSGVARVESALPRLHSLAIGGTAVGTGINAHPNLGERVSTILAESSGIPFQVAANRFEALSSQDTAVELSGQLRTVAVSMMKIANDLRWMNSGPLAGLAEISLPALQPGSSIMPGKVNPVIPESVSMVSAQVMGNDTAISVAGQSGNFQLNVMLPVIAANLLKSIKLLANAARVLGHDAIAGFTVNEANLRDALDRNPILVTALNSVIGYEKGAQIAKQAYQQGRPVIEVAREMTELSEDELQRLLNPRVLAHGGRAE